MQLANNEKYKQLGIDSEEFCNIIQNDIRLKGYIIKKEHLNSVKKIVGDSIEFDIESDTSGGDITRASFYVSNEQIVVIKGKKLNIKLMISMLFNLFEFSRETDIVIKIETILNILMQLLFNVLDEDVSIIYLYLANEYFNNNNRFNNIEIYERINTYLKNSRKLSWSDTKINKLLLQLENLEVIECSNGVYLVKDKIYFN